MPQIETQSLGWLLMSFCC